MRLNFRLWSLAALTAVVLGLVAGSSYRGWRPQISYVLKHMPLCLAENAGLLVPRRAHFSSERGETVDVLRCAPWRSPQLLGRDLGHGLVVVSDLGGLVQRFDAAGQLIWQRRLSMPRGVDIVGNHILVADGRNLHVMDLASGDDLRKFELDQPILAIRLVGDTLFTVLDVEGLGGVRKYDLSQDVPRLMRASTFVTHFARGIDVGVSGVFVADTFGHRVLRLDLQSLSLEDEVPSYFPNSIQVHGDGIVVAEEHLNIVSEFVGIELRRQESHIGCRAMPVGGRSQEDEKSTICAKRGVHSDEELFSPNDAVSADGHVYVADTDNHRIVDFLGGHVVAQLTGFNNPVNVRVVLP